MTSPCDQSVLCYPDDQVGPVQRQAITSTPNCAVRAQNCHLKTLTLVLVILICGLLILYILLWFWYMWRAFRDLQKHQYMHYKMGNLNVRMQASIDKLALQCSSHCLLASRFTL